MIRKIKINEELIKIIISALFFTLSFFTTKNSILYFVLLILSYIVISYEIYIDAFKNIFHGEIFDENFLMILATIGAFYIGEYPEAVMVMLLFEIGEYLSDLAVDNSKESITNLLDLRADYVNLKTETGIKKIDVNAAKIGDIFVVKPGEKIPLDGIIINGDSYLDTSSLTGEGVPRFVNVGDNVLSGTVNLDRALEIKASALFENSAASKIIDLLENATNNKTKTEKFITRFSKIYTPIVVLCAFLLFFIPTLLGYDANTWLYRALEFLVISCPCALVISVPLGFFCGIGRSSKDGILIKSSKDLDNLSKIDTVVFDKTGTITKGNFEVIKIKSYKLGEDELLELTSKVESLSNHPIAKAIVRKYGKDIDNSNIFNFAEIGGMGIKCYLNNEEILVGTKKLLEQNNNLHFIIAGDGPLLKQMKTLARKFKITDSISFLGKCNNPSEIYSICDITVNCSLKEGLALTSHESLSMGVPVVSSDVGGQSELIDDTVGAIVPLMQKEEDIHFTNYLDEEIDIYVSSINRILNNLDKYKVSCRKKIINGFTIDNMIKNFEKEIDSVIKTPNQNIVKMASNIDSQNLLKDYINLYFMSCKEESSWSKLEYTKAVYGGISEEFKKKHRKLYMFKYSTDKFFYKLKIGYQASNLEASIIKFIKNFVRTLKELLNVIINFIKCLVGLIKGIVR